VAGRDITEGRGSSTPDVLLLQLSVDIGSSYLTEESGRIQMIFLMTLHLGGLAILSMQSMMLRPYIRQTAPFK
jgi:hypothetical protein